MRAHPGHCGSQTGLSSPGAASVDLAAMKVAREKCGLCSHCKLPFLGLSAMGANYSTATSLVWGSPAPPSLHRNLLLHFLPKLIRVLCLVFLLGEEGTHLTPSLC